MTTISHFSFPFTIQNGQMLTCEQDSIEEIQDCVEVLLLTPTGSRLVFPSYGTPELLFSQSPANIPAIINQCNKHEPRAILVLQETLNTLDEKISTIQAQITGGIP